MDLCGRQVIEVEGWALETTTCRESCRVRVAGTWLHGRWVPAVANGTR